MARSVPFRLNRSGVLLALLSAAFAGQAGASAGRVDFAIGGATLSSQDGQQRPLSRGTIVNSGDVLRTNNGRVQMRMNDGAYISLQPNTEFGIKGYKFEGKADGTESAFFSLLKGAMRTVTGLIGRVNRDRYQVATPTATVGIRGTGGLIQVLNDGATLVQGTSGIWFLANPAGSIDIPAGVAGLAPVDPKQPPKETVQIPTAGPSPLPALLEYAQGNERTSDGSSVIVPTSPTGTLPSSGGYMASMVFSESGFPDFADFDFYVDAAATFDAAGRMTSISDLGLGFYALGATGTHADFGTDGILAWGRWTGPVTGDSCGDGCILNENYNAFRGFHYVVGIPTSNMPQTGTAIYTLLGATRPTYVDASAAPGTFSGDLTVNFDVSSPSVGMSLNATMPDGKGYFIGGSAAIFGNTFSGVRQGGQGTLTTSGTSGVCSSGCDALVTGFFAGATAERAGLTYHVNDLSSGKDVIGAAAFTKQ